MSWREITGKYPVKIVIKPEQMWNYDRIGGENLCYQVHENCIVISGELVKPKLSQVIWVILAKCVFSLLWKVLNSRTVSSAPAMLGFFRQTKATAGWCWMNPNTRGVETEWEHYGRLLFYWEWKQYWFLLSQHCSSWVHSSRQNS